MIRFNDLDEKHRERVWRDALQAAKAQPSDRHHSPIRLDKNGFRAMCRHLAKNYPKMGGREISNVAVTGLALWRRSPQKEIVGDTDAGDGARVRLPDVLQEIMDLRQSCDMVTRTLYM